jgi:hypothetical protein
LQEEQRPRYATAAKFHLSTHHLGPEEIAWPVQGFQAELFKRMKTKRPLVGTRNTSTRNFRRDIRAKKSIGSIGLYMVFTWITKVFIHTLFVTLKKKNHT